MENLDFFEGFEPSATDFGAVPDPPAERQEGAWRVLPLEGSFTLVYEDGRGAWSTRTLDARELKLGPGRTLLGGIDRARGLYRGLRADRIRRLTDAASGTRIEAGILDWLLARAEAQRRAERARSGRAGTNRARSTARCGQPSRAVPARSL